MSVPVTIEATSSLENFAVGSCYHGFRLLERRYVEDIQAEVFSFEYEKTKTTLVAVKNDDDNKNFCIGFKTLPEDSSGVCHILEHSVLSGSKKYPIKDVFSELTKGSLTTFINAMTYSDKTLYPFATRNEKEYFNLIDVYLDLVLNPLLEENTFLQEGWHYDIHEKDQPLEYNGIVYNEMKGVYSSPFRYLFEKVTAHLLPNSTYSVSSGGMPEDIPQLTYDYFKKFHQKNYHPSNAKIAVYGNADLSSELKFIDEKYLQNFSFQDIANEIKLAPAMEVPAKAQDSYAASEQTNEENDTYLSLAVTTGLIKGREDFMALTLLSDLLMNTEASPLKNALLEAQIGNEVGCMFEDIYSSFFLFFAMGASAADIDKFEKIYFETLKQIVKDGFELDLLESQLNSFEFQIREENANAKRGLNYTLEVMAQLMYGNDFYDALQDVQILKKIRHKALQERFFEKIIEEKLLNNPQRVLFVLTPDANKSQAEVSTMQEKLAQVKKQLSAEALEALVEKTKELKRIQQIPNDPQKLALLPKLSLQDIQKKIHREVAEVSKMGKATVLNCDLFTGQIGYLHLGFDISHLPQHLLGYLDIFCEIFTEIGTSHRDYKTLSKDLGLYTGGLSSSFSIHQKQNSEEVKPIVWFSIKATYENIEKMFDLLEDIFFHCDLSNHRRIHEIIKRIYAHEQYSISSDGYSYALQRLEAYLTSGGKLAEAVNGHHAYVILKDLEKKYKKHEKEFLGYLHELIDELFFQNNLTVSITAQSEVNQKMVQRLASFIGRFKTKALEAKKQVWPSYDKNECFALPSEVVYTGLGFNLKDGGIGYSGALEVLKNYLDSDFLYNQIRVLGGAYGNFSRLNRFNGNMNFISYRDPHVEKTYLAYQKIPQAIRELALSNSQLEQIKINSFAKFDPLLSSAQKGVNARNDYLSQTTLDDLNKIIDEILSVDLAGLKSFADAFEKGIANSRRCTIGSLVKLKQHKDFFDDIIEI